MGSIICLFPAYPEPSFGLFCFVVFELLQCQVLIPYLILNGVLIFLCGYQSFMITESAMSILFNRCVSLQVNPIIPTLARSILSFFFSTVFVSSDPSCLCFLALP